MDLVIVTGLSGAGRTQALRNLEDIGYFCMDNLPPGMITDFVDMCERKDSGIKKAAIAVDSRSGDFFSTIYDNLNTLEKMGVKVRILFMDANDEVLIRRFNETRRQHPMAPTGRVVEGIERERRLMQPLKERAYLVLDTSVFSVKKLRSVIREVFLEEGMGERVLVSVATFGFKRGIPTDADMVFDVRFLPNPFYIAELKDHSGIDEDVAGYIFSFEQTKVFLQKLVDMIEYLLPYYLKEDKNRLVIAIGCTGGMHRSVAIAEALIRELRSKGICVSIAHRDLVKDAPE
jgi:UPF0042 nucleotide-binding protein